ncbi:MAG TPA: hypothetical protein VF834_26030, partial [Streptosporangiaceae bacterium]
SREWMRSEASRVTDLRGVNVARQLNLPPSYVLIHRVSTAGIGVLCQLEASGEFRAEVLRWMPGYGPANLTDITPLVDVPMDDVPRDDAPLDDAPLEDEGPDAADLAREPAG